MIWLANEQTLTCDTDVLGFGRVALPCWSLRPPSEREQRRHPRGVPRRSRVRSLPLAGKAALDPPCAPAVDQQSAAKWISVTAPPKRARSTEPVQ